jgi:hypothetical protein
LLKIPLILGMLFNLLATVPHLSIGYSFGRLDMSKENEIK